MGISSSNTEGKSKRSPPIGFASSSSSTEFKSDYNTDFQAEFKNAAGAAAAAFTPDVDEDDLVDIVEVALPFMHGVQEALSQAIHATNGAAEMAQHAAQSCRIQCEVLQAQEVQIHRWMGAGPP